jgi:hypothetical protein
MKLEESATDIYKMLQGAYPDGTQISVHLKQLQDRNEGITDAKTSGNDSNVVRQMKIKIAKRFVWNITGLSMSKEVVRLCVPSLNKLQVCKKHIPCRTCHGPASAIIDVISFIHELQSSVPKSDRVETFALSRCGK